MDYQREILAFDEKIALAKLEESKASERVRALEYDKARFNLEVFIATMKQQQQQDMTIKSGPTQTIEQKPNA
jgi:hypothetical protein